MPYTGIGLTVGLVATGLSTIGYLISRVSQGGCPHPDLQANFEVEKYMGLWYEFEKLPNNMQFGECTQAKYML